MLTAGQPVGTGKGRLPVLAAALGRFTLMNQADLITTVAEHAGLTKADAGKAVEALVGTITEALKRATRSHRRLRHLRISERASARAATHRPARRSRSRRRRLPSSPPASPSRMPSTVAEPVGTVSDGERRAPQAQCGSRRSSPRAGAVEIRGAGRRIAPCETTGPLHASPLVTGRVRSRISVISVLELPDF